MAFCTVCGAQTPDGATVCPACSRTGAPAAARPVAAVGGGLTDNVAGMLAYVTFIPAIIFLVMEPYNKSRFVRFHAFQSIFLTVALIAISIALSVLSFIPVIGLMLLPVHLLIWLGMFALWIVLLLKANQGQMWKLPVIGDMAEKQANA
ncbi:MAG TPA: DUF4870 domain-containing protein [Terriglobales bacterium]|jgi:uncharacterized membrane protein|nr:DUF4870 domain-containing protein [Terriglobales bacterium]